MYQDPGALNPQTHSPAPETTLSSFPAAIEAQTDARKVQVLLLQQQRSQFHILILITYPNYLAQIHSIVFYPYF